MPKTFAQYCSYESESGRGIFNRAAKLANVNSELNYKELVNEYVQDTSEELRKDANLNQSDETLIQSKVVVDFSPFDISHTLSPSCSSSVAVKFTKHMSIVRLRNLCRPRHPQLFCSNS